MKTWVRDGDVVVATGAKSGTTWMLYCSHAISTKGDAENFPFTDVSYSTPWPDFVQVGGLKKSKSFGSSSSLARKSKPAHALAVFSGILPKNATLPYHLQQSRVPSFYQKYPFPPLTPHVVPLMSLRCRA